MSTPNANAQSASDDIKYATLISAMACAQTTLVAADSMMRRRERKKKPSRFTRRRRRTMAELRYEYGPLFARAYRMSWETFQKLFELIKNGIMAHMLSKSGAVSPEPAPFYRNGPVPLDIRLAMALRWFAGGVVPGHYYLSRGFQNNHL